MRAGGLGLGGLLIVALISYFAGVNPLEVLDQPGAPVEPVPGPSSSGPITDEAGKDVSRILADTEDTWDEIFQRGGRRYPHPTLVLFTDMVDSACGMNSAAVGPFYCPGDQKVYIDLAFFRELDQRFGAPGDFAQAYVIAHEVGHHVQNVLGVFDQVRQQSTGQNAQRSVGAAGAAGRLLRRRLGTLRRVEKPAASGRRGGGAQRRGGDR